MHAAAQQCPAALAIPELLGDGTVLTRYGKDVGRPERQGRSRVFADEEAELSGRMKFAIAGIVVGLILWIVSPWLALGVVVAAIAIPTGAYLMLDPSQRRRVREMRRRRQIGR